jgi:hypothetical protein
VGGDSPDKLIRLPGEPTRAPRVQSCVLLAIVLAETEVEDSASRTGEGTTGRISGDWTCGDEVLEGGDFDWLPFLSPGSASGH